ncbi:TetR/AcrR family transcriptional regulator [Pseudonocardia sp. MH-G8]|uniref:TetR/AcrR family transcriptional regulator n=1 Tax=Pseudonocardia sp. MH-G8 TaxID=1854588 RepID=UPI000BA1279E|nr:TetR/AcrR family transcriptional regulator [Pseudonocardia sp. MH-G8]OZM78845.1 TetR family transcriptional regulator [Pseudonocardia sp. MH-G8]
MPRVSEQHLAARRQQILDAAVALFSERGFARTSMSDVVRESGMSMGAVYRYFPSKADLVIAVGEGHGGEVDGEFPAEGARDLLARLAAEVGPGSSHARLSVQVWGEAAVEPDLAAEVVPIHQRLEEHLTQLLRAGARPDQHGQDDEAIAQVALSAVIGLAALVAAGVPVDHGRFVAALTHVVDPREGATPSA